MAKEFKYVPRFAENEVKRDNLVDFLSSLEISKKYNEKLQRERIENFPEYFLFSNIYRSCSEIIRNESVLEDRNVKARVHTLVTTSSLSEDLAFIAGNVDGVTESLRNKITSFGNEGDFDSLKKAATTWEKTDKEISSMVDKLRTIIQNNLEQGFGTPRQLRDYENTKLQNATDEVKTLYFEKEKTIQEISEHFKVRQPLVQDLVFELIEENLLENIEDIQSKLNDGVNRNDLAQAYKTSRKRIGAFIEKNKLVIEKKKQEKQEVKSEKAEDAKTTTVEDTKAKTKTTKTADAADEKATETKK